MPGLISTSLGLTGSTWSDSHFLKAVRAESKSLETHRDRELREVSAKLREQAAFAQSKSEILIPAFALADTALHRVLGFRLYDVQLLAAKTLAEGKIAEMQTGEGKTFSALPAAVWGGLLGRGVHISTPNSYLAERDHSELLAVYEMAGITAGLLPERTDASQDKRNAYLCDITYGSGYEFGFDYLRDQLVLRAQSEQPLGQALLASLKSSSPESKSQLCQRGLAFAIVDEADNVLVDDATSPLVLSESQAGDAKDAEVVRLARHVSVHLRDNHFHETGTHHLELTEEGRQRIYRDDILIPVRHLQRSWTSYVETALRAERHFQRDVHYVIEDGEIKIVDSSTGRIFADRAWQGGLHQAIEAKEGLRITPERSALAQITRQRFYRLYQRLSGMTGTATTCRTELFAVYRIRSRVIPLRTPSRRVVHPTRFFASQPVKWAAIVQAIVEMHATGRPVLVGTRTIADSQRLAEQLHAHQLPFDVLNDRQDAEEAAIVEKAGQVGKIVIATNMAGRGTDIKLSEFARSLGGLHVIMTECHESSRIDRQMIGRAGRQGDPGSAQAFVALDDWLILNFGSWLADSASKLASVSGEIHINLQQQVKRIQLAAERKQYAVRAQMLRNDLENDNLFDH